MTAAEANERYERLVENLRRSEVLMRENHRDLWADWMAESRLKIEAKDAYGLEHLLRAFGGMSSFNDVVFHRLNGDQITDEEADHLNQRHAALADSLYSDAKALLHDFNWA